MIRRCLLAIILVCLSACGTPRNESGRIPTSDGRLTSDAQNQLITMEELDGLNKAYADRYLTLVVAACEHLGRENPDSEQRRLAHLFKLVSITSVYDIVTNADPYTSLLDLVLVVTLQSQVWIDDDKAGILFGDRAPALIQALRRARTDVWELAARVLKPEQLQVLDWMIWEWRHDNPDIEFVSFVRFGDFSASRAKTVLSDVRNGGGLLAPVSDAVKAVDEVRLLGERAFYYGKRLPLLLGWQADSVADELTAKPELGAAIAGFTSLSGSLARLTTVAETLPEQLAGQRAELRAEIDRLEKTVAGILTGYGQAVGQTQDLVGLVNHGITSAEGLAKALEPTLNAAERLMQVVQGPADAKPAGPPPPPLDANAAVADLRKVAENLTASLSSAERIMTSPVLSERLKEVDGATAARVEQAGATSASVVDLLFWRALILVVTIFCLALLYRIMTSRMHRRGGTP